MKYPIKSKEGNQISTVDDAAIPLHGIKDVFELRSSDEQLKLFNKLGFNFLDDSLTITFKEHGKEYEMPEENRNMISEFDTEQSFEVKFNISKKEYDFPLTITMNLNECTEQPYVNFLGEINFQNVENENITVPLTGRGTAALEGKIDDAHAGLCTNEYCAGFQCRVAILSSILACFKITRDEIEIFRAHLLKVCNKYFGTEEIISYTIDKAFSLTADSYFDYMTNLYEGSENVPIMLLHFMEFGEPHPIYFYELKLMLTEEEIDSELKQISTSTKGPDHQQISLKVRVIINKFILYDGMYLIKPYPGNLSVDSNDSTLTIYDIAGEFNSNSVSRCLDILDKMGLKVNSDTVSLSMEISGKKITDKKQVDEDNKTISLSLKRKTQSLDSLLKLKVYLDIEPIDNVNFFGKIEIRHSFFRKYIIPLPGRGTVELEGSLNDKHLGFCTGNECAAFLQRIAIIYCCLVLLDVDENDRKIFEIKVKEINNKYHGRHNLIDYIFKVMREEETETYFEYMRRINMDYSEMPLVLKTILTYNRLPTKYYEDLIAKFTEEELIKEEERFEKSKYLDFIPRTIRQVQSFIKNLDIF